MIHRYTLPSTLGSPVEWNLKGNLWQIWFFNRSTYNAEKMKDSEACLKKVFPRNLRYCLESLKNTWHSTLKYNENSALTPDTVINFHPPFTRVLILVFTIHGTSITQTDTSGKYIQIISHVATTQEIDLSIRTGTSSSIRSGISKV